MDRRPGVDARGRSPHFPGVSATPTLAEKLGMTSCLSALLHKAKRLGLGPAELEDLAVLRGCRHYTTGREPAAPIASEREFSNEELAVALLSPALRYSPHSIRCGAAMLGTAGNDPETLTRLTLLELAAVPVRYVAEAGRRYEPDNGFWRELLAVLPPAPPPRDGVMPHPTRFISMTGFTRAGRQLLTEWQRPRLPKLARAA